VLNLFRGNAPDHPLADPKEARRILGELPAHDPLKALEELAHWHESVGTAQGFRCDARIELLCMVDEAAQGRLRRVARDYLAGARASRFQENMVWTRAQTYWRECALAYGRAIDGVLQNGKGAAAAAPLLPLLAVRALRALAQQLKWLHLRYAPVEPSLWRVLNNIYAFAEARGIAEAPVVAVYPGMPGASSPRQEFLRALVLSVSSPDSLTPAEMDWAERLIGEFASSFAFGTTPAPALTHWTDLAQATAPQRLAKAPPASTSVRYFGGANAAAWLQTLVQRIDVSGQVPESLGLPPEADKAGVVDLLRRLQLHWSSAAPERKHPRHAVKSRLSIVHGFDAVVGAVAGIASLDFHRHPAESWTVENVSGGGFGARAPQSREDWLRIGALLALQPEGGTNWLVGLVRRVSKLGAGEARVGLQTLSRMPELARFSIRGADEAGLLLPSPDLLLGEVMLAIRAGVLVPGQNLESQRGGRNYVYLPQAVVEHGEDYDLVRFRELVRES
jgi:hypothetical protein